MLVVTAALQVSEQIKDAGAYAGLASILGLAVLALLYFGQARELKRLREWAGRAPERTAELQEQANAAAAVRARRVAPQPVAAAAPMRSPAQTPATAAGAAARPAGSVAAGQAATSAGGPPTARPGAAAPGAAPPGAPAGTPGSVAPGPSPSATPGNAGATARATQGIDASRSAAPANGAPPTAARGQQTQSIPAVKPDPSTSAAAKPLSPDAPSLPPAIPSVVAPTPIGPSPSPTDDSPVPLRQVSAATGAPRRRAAAVVEPLPDDEGRGGPSGRAIGIVLGAITALLLVALLATQVLGGGDDPTPTSGAGADSTSTDKPFVSPPASSGRTDSAPPPVNPGDYSVFVLNGTQKNGIAKEVGKTLETDGFVIADKGNAAINTAPTTEVYYLDGQKRGASAIAKKLDVSPENVKRADRAISVQGPGADVIVQIGADKATP